MDDQLHIRWMIRRDLDQVLAIERECFSDPWTGADFLSFLRMRSCIGYVAELNDTILGYALVTNHELATRIENIAVHPHYRRHGIGGSMMAKITTRAMARPTAGPRPVRVTLRESNLRGQLFFRSCGLKAVGIIRGAYPDTGETGYDFAGPDQTAPHTPAAIAATSRPVLARAIGQ
jgi:[ribosomal protein S18]-alanine N-acetyltransferase